MTMGFLKWVTKWVTNTLILAITSYDREIRGSAKTRTNLRVFDTLCYLLIPAIKSSSLVGPTILFRYLADSQQLMISHLDQFWISEEKSWPVLQREMAGGEQGSEDQDSLQSLKVSRLKPLLCSGPRQLRVTLRGFSLNCSQKITN